MHDCVRSFTKSCVRSTVAIERVRLADEPSLRDLHRPAIADRSERREAPTVVALRHTHGPVDRDEATHAEIDAILKGLDEPMPEPIFEIVNGAVRTNDGSFGQLPARKFHADGRELLAPDRYRALADRAAKFLELIRSSDLVNALAGVREVRKCVDQLEYELVAYARSRYWPWSAIATVLGVHPSAAHRRFAREDVRPRKRRPRST
jgi:hypothetical protein